MIRIKTQIELECKKCSSIINIEADELGDPEQNVSERSMGDEIEYYWIHEINCKKCNNAIQATFMAYEYPIGILNYNDCEITGAKCLKKPKYEVEIIDDGFDNE
jgi:hypothetical protein